MCSATCQISQATVENCLEYRAQTMLCKLSTQWFRSFSARNGDNVVDCRQKRLSRPSAVGEYDVVLICSQLRNSLNFLTSLIQIFRHSQYCWIAEHRKRPPNVAEPRLSPGRWLCVEQRRSRETVNEPTKSKLMCLTCLRGSANVLSAFKIGRLWIEFRGSKTDHLNVH